MRLNPPAPVCTGPVARLTATVSNFGQLYETVFDYMAQIPISVTPVTLANLIVQWQLNCQAAFLNCLSNNASFATISCAEVQLGTTPTQAAIVNTAGTVAADALPGTVAAVITKLSSLKGQHGRGRFYMMSVPVTFTTPGVDNNALNALGLSRYAALNTGALIPLAAGGATWGWSVSTRPLPPATLVSRSIPVASLLVQRILATVRRRREGRGQ